MRARVVLINNGYVNFSSLSHCQKIIRILFVFSDYNVLYTYLQSNK